MLRTFKNGQAPVILRCKILDSSVSTGAGLTGLTSASSGLVIGTIADVEAASTAYTVAGATIEGIATLGTFAAPTATKCRFKEVDATNHKGVYELQFADARFAVANAKGFLVSLSGAANMAQTDFIVQLQADDPNVAKPVNFNLLSVDASGRVDVIKVAGTTQTAGDLAALITAVDDFVDTEVAAIKAKTDLIPAAPAAVGDIPTAVQNADALLGRNVSGGSSAGRTVKQALHFIRNRWTVATGTLTVYDTDDVTASWTAAVTGTAGADPVTGSDPA